MGGERMKLAAGRNFIAKPSSVGQGLRALKPPAAVSPPCRRFLLLYHQCPPDPTWMQGRSVLAGGILPRKTGGGEAAIKEPPTPALYVVKRCQGLVGGQTEAYCGLWIWDCGLRRDGPDPVPRTVSGPDRPYLHIVVDSSSRVPFSARRLFSPRSILQCRGFFRPLRSLNCAGIPIRGPTPPATVYRPAGAG